MPQLSNTKFLGIEDENLNWRHQSVNKKINTAVGIMRRISHFVTINCLLLFIIV